MIVRRSSGRAKAALGRRQQRVADRLGQRAQSGLNAIDDQQADAAAGLGRQPLPGVGAELVAGDELAVRIDRERARVSLEDERPQQAGDDRLSGAGVVHDRAVQKNRWETSANSGSRIAPDQAT